MGVLVASSSDTSVYSFSSPNSSSVFSVSSTVFEDVSTGTSIIVGVSSGCDKAQSVGGAQEAILIDSSSTCFIESTIAVYNGP